MRAVATWALGAAAASILAVASTAQAAVIPGPLLTDSGSGWTTTGLGFDALDNSHLTGFVYQNQGAADTVVLTDAAGNILDSLSTPAGDTSYAASVNWALVAGNTYWLLQTVVSNELLSPYGLPLPSDTDISIIQSGTFAYSIPAAVSNAEGWGANQYWAAFNNITTSTSVIPEPATWAMMVFGFAGLGLAGYRSRRRSAVVAA